MNTRPTIKKAALLLCTAASLCFLPTAETLAAPENITPSIHVTGYAEQEVAPDTAMITLGVTTIGKTPAEAKNANDSIMNEIARQLTLLGVLKQDIKTSHFQVTPHYSQPSPDAAAKIKEYAVTNTLTVTTQDFTLLSSIISKSIDSGATNISGLRFFIKDDSLIRDSLLRQAAQNGKRQAQLVAESLQQQLGSVLEVHVSGVSPSYAREYNSVALKAMAADSRTMIIEEGTSKVSVSLDLTFSIQ